MSNISQLTSKKTKILYILSYSVYSLLFWANPILIMKFVDNVVQRDWNMMLIYGISTLVMFILIQLVCYIFAYFVGKLEMENYSNYFQKLSDIVTYQDLENGEINNSSLNQYLGQYYQSASDFFFKKKVELIFSIINIIVIFTIMFVINYYVASILLVFVPLSFLISKKYENKLYANSEKNISNIDTLKNYINDENTLTKQERFVEYRQLEGIGKLLHIFKKDYMKSVKTKSIYLYCFSYSFLNLAILIVILVSGYLTFYEILTIGSLFAFQNYTSLLWEPGEFLMSYSSSYQEVKPILEKIEYLLNKKLVNYNGDKIRSIYLENFSVLDKKQEKLFKPINYNFELGKSYLIKGGNGKGKTSLIEAILGFNKRYEGKILINGSEEKFNDFVYISADNYISSFYSNSLYKSSSGEKKMKQLELYLKNKKTVYIIDEPTNFVDKSNKKLVYDMVNNLKSNNNIIILISHDENISLYVDKILDFS